MRNVIASVTDSKELARIIRWISTSLILMVGAVRAYSRAGITLGTGSTLMLAAVIFGIDFLICVMLPRARRK